MSKNWDITTIDTTQGNFGAEGSFSINVATTVIRSATFSPDGKKVYVIENDRALLHEFRFQTPWDLRDGLEGGGQDSFSEFNTSTNFIDAVFTSIDGKKFYLVIDKLIKEYSLIPGYALSSFYNQSELPDIKLSKTDAFTKAIVTLDNFDRNVVKFKEGDSYTYEGTSSFANTASIFLAIELDLVNTNIQEILHVDGLSLKYDGTNFVLSDDTNNLVSVPAYPECSNFVISIVYTPSKAFLTANSFTQSISHTSSRTKTRNIRLSDGTFTGKIYELQIYNKDFLGIINENIDRETPIRQELDYNFIPPIRLYSTSNYLSSDGDNKLVLVSDFEGKTITTKVIDIDSSFKFQDGGGIAVDKDENIYVGVNDLSPIDKHQGKVVKLSKDTYDIEWSFGITLASNPNLYIRKIAVDDLGNVYYGDYRNDVRKIDKNGNFIWKFDGSTDILDVAVDKNGNVYSGNSGGSLRKIDSDGNEVWTFNGHGDRVYGVEVDDLGNVYTTSSVQNTYMYTEESDLSLRKIDSNGNEVWRISVGESGSYPKNLKLDKLGNIYVLKNSSIEKIDNNGNKLWLTFLATTGNDLTIDKLYLSSENNSIIKMFSNGQIANTDNFEPTNRNSSLKDIAVFSL